MEVAQAILPVSPQKTSPDMVFSRFVFGFTGVLNHRKSTVTHLILKTFSSCGYCDSCNFFQCYDFIFSENI